jgi:pre-mRNA-splicing factor CWC22
VAEEKEGIEDRTETNLVNLRRVIYLTIMNALNYEEAVHKLLKVQLQEGEEVGCLFTVVSLLLIMPLDRARQDGH